MLGRLGILTTALLAMGMGAEADPGFHPGPSLRRGFVFELSRSSSRVGDGSAASSLTTSQWQLPSNRSERATKPSLRSRSSKNVNVDASTVKRGKRREDKIAPSTKNTDIGRGNRPLKKSSVGVSSGNVVKPKENNKGSTTGMLKRRRRNARNEMSRCLSVPYSSPNARREKGGSRCVDENS